MNEKLTSAVYFYETDYERVKKLYATYSSSLPTCRQAKLNDYTNKPEKMLSYISELMLRNIICKKLGVENASIQFATEEYGKPYLVGQPHFCFNISHTRFAVVVFVSGTKVGIDIESIQQSNELISKRFFSPSERKYLKSMSVEEHDKCFYEIWTKKEAYLKYTGEGLGKSLKSVDVIGSYVALKLRSYQINNYMISVCSDDIDSQVDIILVSDDFFDGVF